MRNGLTASQAGSNRLSQEMPPVDRSTSALDKHSTAGQLASSLASKTGTASPALRSPAFVLGGIDAARVSMLRVAPVVPCRICRRSQRRRRQYCQHSTRNKNKLSYLKILLFVD